MGVREAFIRSTEKSGSKFQAVFIGESEPCPCEAQGDPYIYRAWHDTNPDEPDCGGTGQLRTETSEEFKGFLVPVTTDTEKELTVAGQVTVKRHTLYWPGTPALDNALRLELLDATSAVLATYSVKDPDQYRLVGVIVAQICTLTEVLPSG